ncbi:hypothetical protein [Conexibacter sp. CPCC 206217]|uniref:hypothetical protein n=1 Tax=Conexibacter sp. CPCC 206217 TaxID=3064574 RepID=UPI002716A1B1|nr:hypothetical protein [Conexibacter sp. CPCC 206217]MDO8210431.1 hypothetical protein [Conexibacter sp. CPCC 206217]
MTGNARPHGRRLLRGAIALALLATAAPGTATAAKEPADAYTVEPVEVGVAASGPVVGPDGRMWAFSLRPDDAELLRITAAGVESRQTLPTMSLDQGITSLTGGRIGFLRNDRGSEGLAHEEFTAVAGGPLTKRRLVGPGAVGLAPDGTTWQMLECDLLQRMDTRGRVRRIRLGWKGCLANVGVQRFAFGGDGTTWVVDLCGGRIARVAVDGSQRRWRVRAREQACGTEELADVGVSLAAVPRDDGGLSFGFSGVAGGRIGPRGKLVSASPDLLDVAAPDGSTWYQSGTTLWRRAADGRRTNVVDSSADGRPVHNAAIGPDGRLWFNRYVVMGSKEGRGPRDLSYGVVDSSGGTAQSLDGLLGRVRDVYNAPSVTAGPDGAVWISDSTWPADGAPPPWGATRLLRIVPRTAVPSRGGARPLRVVARSGPTLWLQVRCDAVPGRFCTTSATLRARGGSGSLASTVPAAVPGGASRTVALQLSASVRHRLRIGRTVRADAVVTADDQKRARLAVTLRR